MVNLTEQQKIKVKQTKILNKNYPSPCLAEVVAKKHKKNKTDKNRKSNPCIPDLCADI